MYHLETVIIISLSFLSYYVKLNLFLIRNQCVWLDLFIIVLCVNNLHAVYK